MSEVREWFERYKQRLIRKSKRKGERKGERKGKEVVLAQLFALRLGRPLSPEELATLAARLKQVGETSLGKVLLDASPDALAAWLRSSEAA